MRALPPIVDHRKRRIERIANIVSIVIFIVLLAFPAYIIRKSIETTTTETVTVDQPTLEQYSQLYSTYSASLKCPCTQSTIPYNSFLQLTVMFHQVCSSVFVDSTWIDYLRANGNPSFSPNDFRMSGPYAFQTLATLCQLSKETITKNLQKFYFNQYTSTDLVSSAVLSSQVSGQVGQFISSITDNFLLLFSMISTSFHNNALISSLQTNYRQFVRNNSVFATAVDYNGCNCAVSPQCIIRSSIYQYPQGSSLFDIPGFYTGCSITESLLQSNLQCLYNQACINQTATYLVPTVQVSALSASLPTVFSPNTSINQTLSRLMVEQWNTIINFNQYFQACQPVQCNYTSETIKTVKIVQMNNDLVYLIGLLIGIIGGYVAILNFLLPWAVKLIILRVRNQQIQFIS